jgi:hypothetical protein
MSSEKRILASRANGAKSRGPKTPEGKRASSRNACRHGMLCKSILLEGESAALFAELLADLHAEYHPRPGVESTLIEHMAVSQWRQLRLWGLESASITEEIEKVKAAEQPMQPVNAATRALRNMTNGSRFLEFLNRCDTRYDRQHSRALKRLLDLRAHRAARESAVQKTENDANEPTPADDKSPEAYENADLSQT